MRIALLSPKGPLYRHRKGIFRKSLRYAPLTFTTLASLVPEELRGELTLLDEGIQDIDPQLNADLVGITLITGTAPRAYQWADHFRSRGIPVILSAARLKDVIFQSWSTVNTPSVMESRTVSCTPRSVPGNIFRRFPCEVTGAECLGHRRI